MDSEQKIASAVVRTAKEQNNRVDEAVILTLDDGMRVKVNRISTRLVSAAIENFEKPIPPEYVNQQTGQKMPNTSHPDYVRALEKYNTDIERVSLEAMIMFGIDLLDPIPDNGWEKKIKRLGHEFDETDPDEREYWYKSQIAAIPEVIKEIAKRTGGMNDEQINKSFASFQGDEERNRHSGVSGEGEGGNGDNVQSEV